MEDTCCFHELRAPTQDVVSFAFEKAITYNDNKPLYIDADDPRKFLSYSRTHRYVRQLIAGLKTQGLQDGDAVLVHLLNNYKYASLCLAIVGAGGIFCATNPNYKSEMTNIVTLAKPRFIITTSNLLTSLQEWVSSIALDRVILLDTKETENLSQEETIPPSALPIPVSSLVCHGETDWKKIQNEEQLKATPASYFLTSGTTGHPKLAVLSHYSMVAHFCQIHQEVPYDVVRLSCLPLFHMFGGAFALALTIRYGQPIYIMPRFDLTKYLEYVGRFNVTESFLAPPIINRLRAIDSESTRSQLSSLRYVGVGGAPITAKHMCEFKRMLHKDATLSGVYGSTEAGTVCMLRYGENDDSGSVGIPLPGVKIDIHPISDAESLKTNYSCQKSGEVIISAPSHMMAYKGTSEDNQVDVEYYRMGDLGYMANGKLYISGKTKDIMKVNGFQVSPTEIEAVLLQHDDISDCAVTKIVREGAEMPQAYVVRRTRTVSADEVKKFSQEKLINYKALSGGVVFVTEIPRLPSGKIQRYKLSQMCLEGDSAKDGQMQWQPRKLGLDIVERFLERVCKALVNCRAAKLLEKGRKNK